MARAVPRINEQKYNLLRKLMQCKFEESVYDYLDDGKYQTIEELDTWLDDNLRRFYSEIDIVKAYYKPLIDQEREEVEDDDE